jgi:hypothetical protein
MFAGRSDQDSLDPASSFVPGSDHEQKQDHSKTTGDQTCWKSLELGRTDTLAEHCGGTKG